MILSISFLMQFSASCRFSPETKTNSAIMTGMFERTDDSSRLETVLPLDNRTGKSIRLFVSEYIKECTFSVPNSSIKKRGCIRIDPNIARIPFVYKPKMIAAENRAGVAMPRSFGVIGRGQHRGIHF